MLLASICLPIHSVYGFDSSLGRVQVKVLKD